MIWNDIIGFMKNGKKWSDIKQAQEYFESKDDLDAFLASGWSIQDLKEAKEMVETNPVAQKITTENINNANTQTVISNFDDKEVQLGAFAKLAKEV